MGFIKFAQQEGTSTTGASNLNNTGPELQAIKAATTLSWFRRMSTNDLKFVQTDANASGAYHTLFAIKQFGDSAKFIVVLGVRFGALRIDVAYLKPDQSNIVSMGDYSTFDASTLPSNQYVRVYAQASQGKLFAGIYADSDTLTPIHEWSNLTDNGPLITTMECYLTMGSAAGGIGGQGAAVSTTDYDAITSGGESSFAVRNLVPTVNSPGMLQLWKYNEQSGLVATSEQGFPLTLDPSITWAGTANSLVSPIQDQSKRRLKAIRHYYTQMNQNN